MTETAPRDVAQDAYAISTETMGHDILAALLIELRQMPDNWARLSEDMQQKAIERIKDKVRATVEKCIAILMRGEFAAVPADLEFVNCKNGISAGLKIQKDALYRHQLFDAQGQKVLIVLANADRWLTRMDEIKAKGNQIDLFDGDYDPAVDQPAYRRDRDRMAPGSPTWADLKKSLTAPPPDGETKPPESETKGAEDGTILPADETPGEIIFGTAATEEQERTATLRSLQEQLASIGVGISLGALQAFTAEQIAATTGWAAAYAADPVSCKIARPLWLPIPEQKGDEQ